MNFKNSLVFVALFGSLGGCLVSADDESDDTAVQDDQLGAQKRSWVSVRRDFRKCMAPLCGGYFVEDVNKKTSERYVSDLDFKNAGLDDATAESVRNGEELVLYGKLGPADPQFNTRTFLVYEAYRGMPGVTPIAGDIHYEAEARDPQIQCFTAPCDNEIAHKLNASATQFFTGYSVELASLELVDQAWLANQIENHGAKTAALLVDGQKFPGGYETIMDASQVYLKMPVNDGPCPKSPEPLCAEGTVPTYARSADRCLVFDRCVEPGACAQYVPTCADGYELVKWPGGEFGCNAYACDPAFAVAH